MTLLTDENRKWWTLATLSFSLFMIMLDTTVVNVALPAIQRDLGAGLSELEWIVNAYSLTFAVFLLLGGKLADFLGRRRVFAIGLVVFTASSAACGLATSGDMLIAARAFQGVGAALMLPSTLAIIPATFPPRQRGTAVGIWGGVSALAVAIGPLVGGVLTEHVDWSWIFYINVPVGALGVVLALLIVPESRDTAAGQRLDFPGLVISGAAFFALTFALIEGNHYGWSSPEIVACLAFAALASAAFLLLELRGRAPLLDLALFRNLSFAGANVVSLLTWLALFGVFFFLSLYMQAVLGYSPVQAGAAFVPLTVPIAAVTPLAGRMSDRIGSRWPIAAGMALVGASLVLLSRLGLGADFWDLLPGLVVGGVGVGLCVAPATAAVIGSVPVDQAGVGSGVLNTFRQVGGALGIAIMGAILAFEIHGVGPGDPGYPEAFIDGFQVALLVAAAVVFAGAVTAAATIGRVRRAESPELAEAGI